ncbi:enolase C-terminal domain-like protein [Streptosporangium longisporum]|uniref:L-fuconate dehydratase n=1 Tax=Streptosporangium longisporum TaxID=46187 RepID=A0ABP6KXQ9_9ACTN
MTKITAVESVDLRFPTSRWLDGSDAMNPAPDYSAAYVIIRTDAGDGLEGHGFTFTIGRGNELCTAAIDSYAPFVVGLDLEETLADLGGFWKRLTGESQLRWLGPEKGVVHLAVAAVVNAVWDLRAKREGKPLWRLLSEMSPREIVDLVDFRHIADVLPPERALELLESRVGGRAERTALIHREGVPAYTTSAGWLGYSDDKLRTLATEAVDAGWRHLKLKVGADIGDDVRRAGILREVLGPDRKLMMDANQVWNVDEAIRNMEALAPFDPWWIEEPTSPDDVLGHAEIARKIAPIRVATGEHVQNRVMFKQFLQAGGMGFCQIDACRLGGVNEVVAVLLLAAHHGIPVCPHAGGVGLCEYVQHLSIFDYIAVGASFDDVVVEYVDHLHEHFVDPVRMRNGRYVAPTAPGYSAQMHEATLRDHAYPGGAVWADAR